jgi:acetylornithine deacetylase/succinyl-diaminopimelate desuccinylase-like protein
MKPISLRLFSLVLPIYLLFSWGSQIQLTPTLRIFPHTDRFQDTAEVSPFPIVQDMIAEVNQTRILSDLRKLAGVEPICTHNGCSTIADRETGSAGLQWAKDYVIEELDSLGYSVVVQDWSRDGYSDQNLIVRKIRSTTPLDEIYFVAHLDGISGGPAADDNGSGAVLLLELARILKGHYFSKTIVLLFSTGEEHGALGASSYIAGLSPEELSHIQYVIDTDMVGYDSNNDGMMEFWSGEHQPSFEFAQSLIDLIGGYQIDLEPEIVIGCT